jgi:hypothetical protein
MKVKAMIASAGMLAALIWGGVTPDLWAEEHGEFDEAEIFFELNNTDGDLGIHSLIDGDAWDRLEIKDPDGKRILDVKLKKSLADQGLTEFFFESAEPVFTELDPADFFDRFPEGEYTIEGETIEGEELESVAELTHVMPAPPAGVLVSGFPAAEDCDADPLPSVDPTGGVTIEWDPVILSHPDPDTGGAGVQPPVAVEIHNYEVVVEVELADEFESEFKIILPPDVTSITVPEEFFGDADEFKFEVLAREVSFNQTAVESCAELD